MKRNILFVLYGGIFSIILLGIFLYLQSQESSPLDLPKIFLMVSLAPTLVGLIVGGYVQRIKIPWFIEADILKLPDALQTSTSENRLSTENGGWQSYRSEEYKRTGDLMLVHAYRPSNIPDQKFDIFIFLVKHQKNSSTPPKHNLAEVDKAEFYFGESWNDKTFEISNNGEVIGVRAHAYGTFLATCRVSFKDKNRAPVLLNRYIDFEMASHA
jgi:hypothetical protein